MTDASLDRALDHCLYALRKGATVDECLVYYAEYRQQLAPLLAEAVRLAAETPATLALDRRLHVRQVVMGQIRGRAPARGGLLRPAMVFMPAAAVVLVAAVLIFAYGVTQAPEGAEAATVLTVLQGDVQIETASGIVPARNGMQIKPGEQILTGSGGRAVLTFFEGSTVTLEGETTVVIRSVVDNSGRLRVRLLQSQGSTWTHVPLTLDQADVEIDTPNAKVQTNQASFATTVERGGRTRVGAQTGALELRSGGQLAEVRGGSGASVDTIGVVTPSKVADLPNRELQLTFRGPIYAFVTDPNGATVGRLSPGVPVNQVPGATARVEGDAFVVRIPEPAAGIYRVGFVGSATGDVVLNADLRGATNVSKSTGLRIDAGDSWRAELRVTDTIAVGAVERLADARLPLVTVPERAIQKAKTPVATATVTATPRVPAVVGTPVASATPVR